MTQYFIDKYRILTPKDVIDLYLAAEKPHSKYEFMYYISTGMRYNEGRYIIDCMDKFDIDNRIIHFISSKKWDRERHHKDREIYLSYWDLINVRNYMVTNRNHIVNPTHTNLTKNLINWSNHLGASPKGIGIRAVRKTRFVWLLKAYPEYEDVIIRSMDYDPDRNKVINDNDEDIDTYKKVPFTEKEIKFVKSLLYGWSGAPE